MVALIEMSLISREELVFPNETTIGNSYVEEVDIFAYF